jgi:hypothetical protein
MSDTQAEHMHSELEFLKERIFDNIEQIAISVSEYSNGYLDIAPFMFSSNEELFAVQLDEENELEAIIQEIPSNKSYPIDRDTLREGLSADMAVHFIYCVEEISLRKKGLK